MGLACFQPQAKQGIFFIGKYNFVMRNGRRPLRQHMPHNFRILQQPDGSAHNAALRHLAMDKRIVGLPNAILELVDSETVLGYHHQPRCVSVQPVKRTKHIALSPAAAVCRHAVGKRIGLILLDGMYRHIGRLVGNEKKAVLIDDSKLAFDRLNIRAVLLGQGDHNLLTRDHGVNGAQNFSVRRNPLFFAL